MYELKAFDDFKPIEQLLHPEVFNWINDRIKNLLIDYLSIKEYTNTTYVITDLSDYSYLAMPAFKALEGVLFQIAAELKLEFKKNVGWSFTEGELNKYYDSILDKIERLTKDDKSDIKAWLHNARMYLRTLRHNPAHYLGEPITNYRKALLIGDTIISTIDNLCLILIQNDLFPSIVIKKQAIEKEKQDLRRKQNWKIIGEVKR